MKDAVLVVDDSDLIINIMNEALRDDYLVISAKNGKEAVDLVSGNKDCNIVCMLLDLSMPIYDGFMVLDYFKTYDMFKKIPVFIISGDDTKETINRAFTYDIVDMLNKPFSMSNIKNVVSKAINLGGKK